MKYDLTSPRVREMAEQVEKGFLLPEGKHLMRVREVTHKFINDKEAWELQLEVAQGEPHDGTRCRDTLFFTEKALGRVLMVLSKFGLSDQELAKVGEDPSNADAQRIPVGKLAIVEVKHGKPNEKGVVYANPTYAGYSVAHVGSIEDMKRERAAAGQNPSGGAAPAGGGAASPATNYGPVPF